MTDSRNADCSPSQDPEEFAELVVEAAGGTPGELRRRALTIALVCIAISVIVSIAWLTPLRHYVDIDHLSQLVAGFSAQPFAPVMMIGLFVVGGMVVLPVNVLTAVTILAFGPIYGSLYALIGCELSAIVLFEMARRTPLSLLRRRLGVRSEQLHRHLLRHGILAVALVRLVPVAPYTLVNLILGMLRIARWDYVLGTALGMTPGILLNAFFVDRVVAAIQSPSPLTFALVALAVTIAAGLALFVRRRLAKRAL